MVSMLITTFNRGPLLRRALDRLAGLTLPDELIVVNDGGEEDCGEVVGEFSVRTGVESGVYFLDNPGRTICSRARNYGLGFCRGDIVLTTEPEVVFRSDLIAQAQVTDAVLGPETVFFAPATWQGDLAAPGEQATGWIAPYSAFWKREWLEAVGGWDEDFPAPWGGEDIDLFQRLEEIGVGRRLDPAMEVVHIDHPGGSVALKNSYAAANRRYLYQKPYTHGRPEHVCTAACRRARGVILPRR